MVQKREAPHTPEKAAPPEPMRQYGCGSLDYPVMVYYVNPSQMYLEHVSWHWHEELEFNIINNGRALITVGSDLIELSAGEGIFINQNALHTISSAEGSNCAYYSIVFHTSYLFGYGNTMMSVKYLLPVLNAGAQYLTLSETREEEGQILEHLGNIAALNLSHKYGMELMTKSELCQIWTHLLRLLPPREANGSAADNTRGVAACIRENASVTQDAARVKQAITYIQDHYMLPLSLDDIAGSVHLSRSECCRCFKRALSMTPFEYLMTYRIYSAAQKLDAGDPCADSISVLAESVGFNNASYFNKIFKKYLHCTPGEYKQAMTGAPDFSLNVFGHPLASPPTPR